MFKTTTPNGRIARRRSSAWAILSLAGVALVIAVVPASASAEIRTGLVEDPEGDTQIALNGGTLDLKSVAIRYDTAGTLRVTWTYYHDVRVALGGPVTVQGDAYPAADNESDYAYVNWSLGGESAPISTYLDVMGVVGTLYGTGTMSDDGRVITAEFSHAVLAGRNWTHGFPNTRCGDANDKFWFDGFAPQPPANPTPPTGPAPVPPGGGGNGGGGDNAGGANANQGMTINNGALYTNDPDVTLSVVAPNWAHSLRVANDGGFGDAKSFPVRNTIRWHLTESGRERLPKTVYLRFGNDAQNFTDDIILDQTKPTVTSAAVGGPAAAAAEVTATTSKARTYRVRIRAKDATSGVARVQFATRSKSRPSALQKFAGTVHYRGAQAPKYARVQDRAGNFSRWRSIR
jgi:hypothetical protein